MEDRTFKVINFGIDFITRDVCGDSLSNTKMELNRLASVCYVKGNLNEKEFKTLSSKIDNINWVDNYLD